jgi:RNA polymerase sigma-70 factor (ECF subfamily)
MYKMLRQDEGKAQDFTQDVFLKVVEFSDKFDTNKSFKTWIFTIAANHCKNYFRSNKQLVEINASNSSNLFQDNKEDEYDKREFRKRLNTEVDKLSPTYKETFLLRYKEDLKLKEIAVVMNCPVGTIKSRLNHVNRVLSDKLKAYEILFNPKTK